MKKTLYIKIGYINKDIYGNIMVPFDMFPVYLLLDKIIMFKEYDSKNCIVTLSNGKEFFINLSDISLRNLIEKQS